MFWYFSDFSEMQGKVWNFHPFPASTAGKAPDPFYVSEQDESHTVKCRSFTSSDEEILRVFSQHTHKVACSSCAMHIDHVSSDGLLRPQNGPHPHISLSSIQFGALRCSQFREGVLHLPTALIPFMSFRNREHPSDSTATSNSRLSITVRSTRTGLRSSARLNLHLFKRFRTPVRSSVSHVRNRLGKKAPEKLIPV